MCRFRCAHEMTHESDGAIESRARAVATASYRFPPDTAMPSGKMNEGPGVASEAVTVVANDRISNSDAAPATITVKRPVKGHIDRGRKSRRHVPDRQSQNTGLPRTRASGSDP